MTEPTRPPDRCTCFNITADLRPHDPGCPMYRPPDLCPACKKPRSESSMFCSAIHPRPPAQQLADAIEYVQSEYIDVQPGEPDWALVRVLDAARRVEKLERDLERERARFRRAWRS